jgi:serine/threonine protein kinase
MGVCTSQPREFEGSKLKSQPPILEAELALIRQENFNKLLQKRLGQCAISDFELGKMLGKGSCGTVRLAKHLKSGKHYAAKILSVREETDLKQAKNESEIMLTIDNHPNIIRLEGICHEEQCQYLIQEFAEGGDVFTLLRKLKRFDALSAQFYIAQTVNRPHTLPSMNHAQ